MPSIADAFRRLRGDARGPFRLYVAGGPAEPLALADALGAEPELACDVCFAGLWFPGINRTDWASLHERASAETAFLSADLRASFDAGRTVYRPMHYTDAYADLETAAFDGAVVVVSPPDDRGEVSLGVSADFSDALIRRTDVRLMAIVNPMMPMPQHTVKIPLSRFDVVVEDTRLLVTMPEADLPDAFAKIGEHIAALVGDAAAHLQFGLGNVQQAVLKALAANKSGDRLRIHSGMVSDPVLELIASGRIKDEPGAIVTGVALGTQQLYDHVARDRRFAFHPVPVTHGTNTLAGLERFIAINSVLEVDLTGQANAEYLRGRQVSGLGGLVNFLRGAWASPGGLPIVALPSTAANGSVSRITAKLDVPSVSVSRHDVGLVVTEYGVADLRGVSIEGRAERLIAIAHPDHRGELSDAFRHMRQAI